ncbi:hypothetical protein BGZ83_006707 [Gryganskiella cystojenkinii]|nr:hypothetical protein BGZ83_006707 [Gryganskiella cystojenkinii]
MADPESSSYLHQDISNNSNYNYNSGGPLSPLTPLHPSTSLPPPSPSSFSSGKEPHHNHLRFHQNTPPPPVKARSPFSNLGDQIVKAARRLSSSNSTPTTTNAHNLNHQQQPSSSSPSSSPMFSRLGASSPDLKKKKRRSTLLVDDSGSGFGFVGGSGHSQHNSSHSNGNSSSINSTTMASTSGHHGSNNASHDLSNFHFNNNNINNIAAPPTSGQQQQQPPPKQKVKGKLLAKIDLFNMLSRNSNQPPPSSSSKFSPSPLSSSGATNGTRPPQQLPQRQQPKQQLIGVSDKTLPGPPTPSKETFWRGILVRQNGVCTEDDYKLLPNLNNTTITTTPATTTQTYTMPPVMVNSDPVPLKDPLPRTKTTPNLGGAAATAPAAASTADLLSIPTSGVSVRMVDSKFGSDSSNSNNSRTSCSLSAPAAPAVSAGHTDLHDNYDNNVNVDFGPTKHADFDHKNNKPAESRKGVTENRIETKKSPAQSTAAATATSAPGTPQSQQQQQQQPQPQWTQRGVSSTTQHDRKPTSAPIVVLNEPRKQQQLLQSQLIPRMENLKPQAQQLTSSTMSQDLSHLSISSLQESDASLSDDKSLLMEELFDFYADSSSDSLPQSSTQLPVSSAFPEMAHPSMAPEQTPKSAPLSALEKIQRQQRRRSQEQERLANLILPPAGPPLVRNQLGGGASNNILHIREMPRELMQVHQFHKAATPSQTMGDGIVVPTGPASPVHPADPIESSVRLDQILALASGPNRPRLPNPIEWQKGLEEMRQRRKDTATPLTSSVGRHSQDSSMDGEKSRRHSMPNLPPGQSREDQERQRGDNFRNPMLLRQIHETLSAEPGVVEENEEDSYDMQQQARNRLSADSQAMNAISSQSNTAQSAPIEPPKFMRKRGTNVTGAVSPLGKNHAHDKDAVDIAFDDLLTSLAVPMSTRAELESLPKERKLAMLHSNDANPNLYQTPQTMPPQFFVDTLLEYAGKNERSSQGHQQLMNLQLGSQPILTRQMSSNGDTGPTNRPLGLWKNLSTTNVGQADNLRHQQQQLMPTFQQHMASLMGRNNNRGSAGEAEKRAMEEREQVLKKLRVLIRNGSIRWTGEFIKAGGPTALVKFCDKVQKTRDSKHGQRERLLHQAIQCIKALVPLEGGITSLVLERSFFPLMRTLAISEAQVLASTQYKSALDSRPTKTGLFAGSATTDHQQRSRSSSTPKPIPDRMTGHHQHSFALPSQTSPAPLFSDQIPTFANAQASVSVLTAILAREPELRDQILEQTVADELFDNETMEDDDDIDENQWTYTAWIGYLKELLYICGVGNPQSMNQMNGLPSSNSTSPTAQEFPGKVKGTAPSKVSSVASGLSFLSSSPSGVTSGLSLFENIKRRRHTSATQVISTSNTSASVLKFEAGEDREVISFLTAHLELVSKLMFDMHVSVPGLAFAKSIRDSDLQESFERILSSLVQSQDLCAQVEDLLIQISMVPKPLHNTFRMAPDFPERQQYRVSYPQPSQQKLLVREWSRPASASPQPSQQRQQRQHQMQLQAEQQRQQQYRGSPLPGPSVRHHHQHHHSQQQHPSLPEEASRGTPARSNSLNTFSPEFDSQLHRVISGGRNRGNSHGAGGDQFDASKLSQSPTAGGQYTPLSRQPSGAGKFSEGMVILGRDGAISPMSRARYAPSPIASPSIEPPRRATIGETVSPVGEPDSPLRNNPTSPAVNSQGGRQPTIPPKNKNRPSSTDAKAEQTNQTQPQQSHSRLPLPLSGLQGADRPRARYSKSHLPPTPSALSNSTARAAPSQATTTLPSSRQEKLAGSKVPLAHGPSPLATGRSSAPKEQTRSPSSRGPAPAIVGSELASLTSQLPGIGTLGRSNSGSSTNTFGNTGRRSSPDLDSPVVVGEPAEYAATTPEILSSPATATPSTITTHGHRLRPPRASGAGLEGSSSSSISTSSTFTESSSTTNSANSSYVSATSNQGRKQTQQQQQPVQRSLTPTTSTTAATVMGSRLPVPTALPSPLSALNQPASTVTSKITTVPLVQKGTEVVDFDLKIREDVRKLASAASSSSLSAQFPERREIQETADPMVLSAPIVVREDMFRQREQNIRDQYSAIVLPPLE